MPEAVSWWVAQTETQREGTAATWLERDQREIYLPRIKVRRNILHRPRSFIVALFPGYLFIRPRPDWYGIESTIGVLGLLRTGDRPAEIDDSEITKIRDKERGGLVRLPEKKTLQPGDQVRIIRGLMADRFAIYDGMSGKERVRVLYELVSFNLKLADIEPIQPG